MAQGLTSSQRGSSLSPPGTPSRWGGRTPATGQIWRTATSTPRWESQSIAWLIACHPGQVLSKKHAKIVHKGGTVFLQDLGSTNGTYINKTRLSRPGGDCNFVSHWTSIIRETKQTERDLLWRPGPVRNWGDSDTTSPGQCDHHWPGWGSPQ